MHKKKIIGENLKKKKKIALNVLYAKSDKSIYNSEQE